MRSLLKKPISKGFIRSPVQTKAFLFGAGVNEKTFPQFNGFAKTLNKLKNSAAKKII